jgi:hypothetical protein
MAKRAIMPGGALVFLEPEPAVVHERKEPPNNCQEPTMQVITVAARPIFKFGQGAIAVACPRRMPFHAHHTP